MNTSSENKNFQPKKAGFIFTKHTPKEQSLFDRLFEVFQELITHTSGDFDEAMDWLKQLDEEYKITTEDYTLEDFVQELKDRGFIREQFKPDGKGGKKGDGKGGTSITEKLERSLRKRALEQISMTESIRNAQINHGIGDFHLTENDLVVEETMYKAQMSTVLMIDISHSMILYGEDRITPAKKVAMALSELITTRYPKDTLDILVFGNDAWPIKIKDLPYLNVGPYHTNTVAGLQLAMDMLRRKRNTNKQIFMITDGKPSCLRLPDGRYYKNSNGLDEYIVNKCYMMARQARKLHIPITTFMIASDPYLQQFVDHFTEANQGKAFYTGLQGLGEMIFTDYENNRKKKLR
jgi:hypothetical protein